MVVNKRCGDVRHRLTTGTSDPLASDPLPYVRSTAECTKTLCKQPIQKWSWSLKRAGIQAGKGLHPCRIVASSTGVCAQTLNPISGYSVCEKPPTLVVTVLSVTLNPLQQL